MKTMEINFTELTVKIQKSPGTHENLLASATITLRGQFGEFLTISGFTIWKSKYGGFNVEMPGKKGFKYCMCDKIFGQKLVQEIIRAYEYSKIPIIEEKDKEVL